MPEWTYGTFESLADPCNNCAVFRDGEYQVFRGGGWDSTNKNGVLAAAIRGIATSPSNAYSMGFRCARAL